MNGRYKAINADGHTILRTSSRATARLVAEMAAERFAESDPAGMSAAAVYDCESWTCETWTTNRRTWKVQE